MHIGDIIHVMLREEGVIINTGTYQTETKQLYLDDDLCVVSVNSWIRQDANTSKRYMFKGKLYSLHSIELSLRLLDERHSFHSFKWPILPIRYERVHLGTNLDGVPEIRYFPSDRRREKAGFIAELMFGESDEPEVRPAR